MLTELAVANLGVIDQVTLQLSSGLIALTGETGAGKTLMIDAINLLLGGRADPGLVKHGADEATVDGRFILDGEEVVLTRVIPAEGRSRAYINGRPSTAAALTELGARLVDLHGQHSHQSLLSVTAQRDALDRFGDVDLDRLEAAKAELSRIESELAGLGGDERSRARELDLLRYQVRELDEAAIEDQNEDERLEAREELLANALGHQDASSQVLSDLTDDGSVRDLLAKSLATLEIRSPFKSEAVRLRDMLAELDDLVDSVRGIGEGIEDDPAALEQIQSRRHLLHQLRRKYGDSMEEVLTEHAVMQERLTELEDHDVRAAKLDGDQTEALKELASAGAEVLTARLKAAPLLASAIEVHLPELAMPKAKVGIEVAGDDGSNVSFLLSANPGSPLQALSKVASGGELARAMLALRSVLSEAPPILVFDEVDAGIGGEAGTAVGRSLASLGVQHQVLVVTHLPQVAAFADIHLVVEKHHVEKAKGEGDTISDIRKLTKKERIVELARMLAGEPDSKTARTHAKELLAKAS